MTVMLSRHLLCVLAVFILNAFLDDVMTHYDAPDMLTIKSKQFLDSNSFPLNSLLSILLLKKSHFSF